MEHKALYGRVGLAVAILCLLPVVAAAAPIFGTFNIAGTISVGQSGTTQTITWISDISPFPTDKATVGSTGLSGSFVGLGGTQVSISNLSNPPQVVDAGGFAPVPFISFDARPALGTMFINFIAAGVNSSAQCGAPPAVGQVCALPGSPFDFQNTPGGGSRAGFIFSGNTGSSPTDSTWTGNFTSQFNVPYQQVFAQLAATGTVTNTFSATFTVVPIPEPASLLLGLGGICLLLGYSRKRS